MDDHATWSLWTGAGMQKAREASGLSLHKLAARCAELEVPIHRVALSKIEAGERTPTIDEITVIAVALKTSPAMLIFGADLIDGPVELLPSLRTAADHALQWFSGESPLTPDVHSEYRQANYPIYLAQRLEDVKESLRYSIRSMKDELGRNDQHAQTFRRMMIECQESLSMLQSDARDSGLILNDIDDGNGSKRRFAHRDDPNDDPDA
ncbi:hypothetical protein BST33_09960 [Mycolicibacter minnesotensis]|uniref:Uncharacterized protein n=1 Tax=Mycolicibacter minnesotensis TaxID=1118379 RepID=A0A7I7R5C9_9MYCO|nr:helix-turn-helix transcriptional regulator [Mycolicibacter minnesotensis]ORB01085.1 hypothetical protein BST33_09960 [Mycolicibacter minnesotensis]BBY33377.1 hypothetical protein MMIN_14380 [Mycolicibacter minnesotensis]